MKGKIMDTNIIAVVVGALLVGVSTWLTNLHLLRVQQRQWQREDEKAEREAKRQDSAREIEQKKREREEVLNNYAEAIADLSYLAEATLNINSLRSVQAKLLPILVSYPDKDSDTYKSFRSLVSSHTRNYAQLTPEIYNSVMKLSQEDPRLRINSRY